MPTAERATPRDRSVFALVVADVVAGESFKLAPVVQSCQTWDLTIDGEPKSLLSIKKQHRWSG